MGFLDTLRKANAFDDLQMQGMAKEQFKIDAYNRADEEQKKLALNEAVKNAYVKGQQEGLASQAANLRNADQGGYVDQSNANVIDAEIADAKAAGIKNPTMQDIEFMRRLKSLERLQGGSIGAASDQGLAAQGARR